MKINSFALRRAAVLLVLACLPRHASAADSLSQSLDKILGVPALNGAIVGAVVERVRDGQILYARNPDTRLTPASNRKLFTSAAALELLGGDFTFTTELRATARPDAGGVLHGDVYLRGVGDSLLTPDDLEAMAQDLKKAGVRQVTGRIYGDGSCFTDGPYGRGWEWDDFSDYYSPQIAGLEVSRGVLAVHVTPGPAPGAPVQIAVDQPTRYLPIASSALTVAKGEKNTCVIARPWDQNLLTVTGGVPLGDKADGVVTVADPPRYAATVLAETLARDGVAVGGAAATGKTPAEATLVLASHTSLPMRQYIAKMNKPSDNLLAESLVRVLGAVKGQGGDYDDGHALEVPFLKSLGLDTDSLEMVDGSGLSRRNFVTPRAVAALLVGMHSKSDWADYYASLPIAGVDGTLRLRLKGTKAQGNLHGKTGSLGEVSALSGYLTGAHGELYAFSLIENNFRPEAGAKGIENAFAQCLADSL